MAFNPAKYKFKPLPITLYVASWGPDQWITHWYQDEESGKEFTAPLVFNYGQQKVHPGNDSEPEVRYAYHILPKGGKHGVEYLTKDTGEKARIWNAKSMLKTFTDLLAKKYGITESPTYSVGKMTNDRNDAYAHYNCGLTMGVHIARPDAENPDDDNIGTIWYSAQINGHNYHFDMSCKEVFVEGCATNIKAGNQGRE